jgi:ABC-type nitrate/sulfonate/bicarbonate transport system ATPase subunit
MTPRPGRIREILSVKIPRPRDTSQVRADSQAVRLRAYIWDRLKQDAEQNRKG